VKVTPLPSSTEPAALAEPPGAAAAAAARMRRAGQLVSERRLAEAEVEIVEALVQAPDDLRAHKLLALVRFRLGRLAEARASYRKVVQDAPEDAAARLNLGLIALKLEEFDDAAHELGAAVRLRPDDTRARTYLGHALVRLGRTTEAARAFRQAGQPELAEEIERRDDPDTPPPARLVPPDESPFDARERPEETPSSGPSTQPLTGFVHARLLDVAAAPAPAPVAAGVYRLPLGDAADAGPAGEGRPQAYVQAASLLAAVGTVAVEPARRRQRGQETAAPLAGPGGADAFLACRGQGELWLTPTRPAGTLDAITLEEDVLFVQESSVLAFSGALVWESGAIPRSPLRLLHLHGSGRIVVDWSGRNVAALRMSEGQRLTVPAARLCGWIGHVVVHLVAQLPLVACEGEGVLLIARDGQAGERVYQRPEPGHDGPGHPDPGGAALHR
jgi:Flp pilus assembly protein TadD/uncharacterized protein (AIM24 family)